jgi:tRNA(Ile)-lysidine synthase
LVVAHLDHRLRPSSSQEAQAVAQICRRLGIPFVLGQEDVSAVAEEQGLSLEEAARLVRYRFLFQQAEIHEAQAVAVGHTADDQVETVLMHLLRGAGLDGLTGMSFRSLPNPWSYSIPLVRPLLGVWREEIEAYLSARDLLPIQDESNQDRRFYRNRLRHELIPYLQDYNPAIKQALWNMADVLREDAVVLDKWVETAWEESVLGVGIGYVALKVPALQAQPLGLQRMLLRRAINQLRPGLRDIEFTTIASALAFLETPTQSKTRDLAAGLRLLQEGERLWLAAWEADLPGDAWPQLLAGQEILLPIPGEADLSGGWRLSAQLFLAKAAPLQEALGNPDPYQTWVDASQLASPLIVRSRSPGDRFRPLGMQGHSLKLSDFMINEQLPRRARQGWPLVCSKDEIIWIPGLRLSHAFRLQPGSRDILHLQLSPTASDSE